MSILLKNFIKKVPALLLRAGKSYAFFDLFAPKSIISLLSANVIILSFAFFGFGVFNGIGIGTVICALLNGFLIGKTSEFLEKHFEFVNGLPLEKFFI